MPGYFEILKNADKRYEAEKAVTSAKTVQGQISMPLEKSKLPLRDINTLPSNPAEKYICVYDCAFNGTYDEVAKHEQNCSLREENNKESVTVKPNNLFPSESLFACEKGCGFTGTFQAVAAHEKTCQYGIAMYTGRKSGMSGPVTQSGATTPRLGSAVRVGSNVQGENGVHRLQSAAPVVSVPTQFLRAPTHGPFPVVPPGGVMQTLPMYGQPMVSEGLSRTIQDLSRKVALQELTSTVISEPTSGSMHRAQVALLIRVVCRSQYRHRIVPTSHR